MKNLKAKIVLVATPLLILSIIFSINFYIDFNQEQKNKDHWAQYGGIKSREILKPNITYSGGNYFFGSSSWDEASAQKYPVIVHTYYIDKYVQYTFLMPSGLLENVWVKTK